MVGFMIYASRIEGFSSIPANIINTITTPFQQLSSSISSATSDFVNTFVNAGAISEENDKLREENQNLRDQLADYVKTQQENEQLKEYLEIKDENPDLQFSPALVIGRDPLDPFYSFTIDKGSADGIEVNDPVITADGIVGKISEVSLTQSKVETLLHPDFNMSVLSVDTRATGLISGSVELAQQGLTKIEYLSDAVTEGEPVLTSNAGRMFPEGIFVGYVKEIVRQSSGMSDYAIITPSADISSVKDVLIITSFESEDTE